MSAESPKRWPLFARVAIGIFAVIGAACLSFLFFVFVYPVACRAEQIASVPSPTDAYVATVDLSTCHGATIPNVEVYVGRKTERSYAIRSTSIFIAPSRRASDDEHTPPLHVYVDWTKDDELRVTYPWGTRFNSRTDHTDTVAIVYREASPH